MGLPKALLDRLNKRGLLSKQDNKDEEVFAEDYDETNDNTNKNKTSSQNIDPYADLLIRETANCPNIDNPYHNCNSFCIDQYGQKKFRPDPKMNRLRDKMLKKYPLPANWVEVGDPQTGRFFYWNLVNDDVSWLSPIHPRAQITRPSDQVKEMFIKNQPPSSKEPIQDIDERLFDEDRRRGRRRRRSSSRGSSSSRDGSRRSPSRERRRRRRRSDSDDRRRPNEERFSRRYSRSRSRSRNSSRSHSSRSRGSP